MLSSVESVSETMIVLMKSTGNYVATRIQHKVYKHLYIDTLKKCIAAVDRNIEDFETFKAEIESISNSFDLSYKRTFFNSMREERKYYDLACTHALDIITNLNARFNTGTFDFEPKAFKGKGWPLYNDEFFS